MDRPLSPRFKLALFGPFELEATDGPVPLTSRKVAGLLAVLACTAPVPQSRDKLIDLLWGSQAEAQARQNLRQALTSLRRALGETALVTAGQMVSLQPGTVACDVARFEALTGDGSREALSEAIGLYKDRFLADATAVEDAWADWVTSQRQRLEALAVDAMLRLAEQELALGHPTQALAAAKRAIALDDLREDAHRLAIRALSAAGRRADALKHYDEVASVLRRELDVAPDAATQALAAELRQGRPPETALPSAPAAAGPPVVASAGESGNRPSHLVCTPDERPTRRAIVDAATTARVTQTSAPNPLPRSDLQEIIRRSTAHLALHHRPSAAWMTAAAVLFGALGLALLTRGDRSPVDGMSRIATSSVTPPAPTNTFNARLAVLPFTTSTGSDALQAFAERLTDDFTNHMSRTTMLQVVSSQAAVQPTDPPSDIKAIGAKLGVQYIFRGNVSAQGDKIRVNVSLIDVRSGLYLWSNHFAEDRSRWPSLQEEIVRRTTWTVHIHTIRRGDTGPVDPGREPTVGQLLARGWMGIAASSDTPQFRASEAAFSEALRRDPESLSAMHGLAAYYLRAISELKIEREPYLTRAEDLLRRVLPRRPNEHGVHHHLAVMHILQKNLPGALQALDRAIEINPSHAPSHARKGRIFIKLQRYEEALEIIRYALRLNSGTFADNWNMWAGWAELELGRDDAARQAFKTAVATRPQNPHLHASLAALHALSGEWAPTQRHVTEFRKLTPRLTDQQRLVEFNMGPDGQALQNRLGKGLRLALDATNRAREPGSHPFDGMWHVAQTGNEYCVHPQGEMLWTIARGNMNERGEGAGVVSSVGEFNFRRPGRADPSAIVVHSGRLEGNRGSGRYYQEGRSCAGTFVMERSAESDRADPPAPAAKQPR